MTRRIRAKVYRQGREVLVAACDSDVVGKAFEQGDMRLAVTEAFYGTQENEVTERFLLLQLRTCTMANLVGETVVTLAIRAGFINRANVIAIGGVPHAQLVTL